MATDKYLTIVNSMDQGFSLIEAIRNDEGEVIDYRVLELNPAFEKQTGIQVQQVLQRTIREVFPVFGDWWIQTFAPVVDKKQSVQFERYFKDQNRWYSVVAHPMQGGQFAIFYNDITERKQTEAALRRSEERLRRVLETGAVAVLFFNYEGVLIDANDVFLRTSGYSRKELLHRQLHWRNMTPPEWVADCQAQMSQLAATGRIGPYQKQYFRKDGSRLWLLFTGRDLGDGTIVEFGVFIDNLKEAEEALRESEERFRSYFELGLIGMAISSPARDVLEVNDEICKILGYSRQELLTMSWTEITHPDDLAADLTNFGRVLSGEIDGYSMDKRWIRKDGQVIDSIISVKAIRNHKGEVDYFVALLQDITERKRVDAAMRQAKENHRIQLEVEVQQRTEELKEHAHYIERVVNNVPDTIFIYDLANQQCLFANQEVVTLLGYTPEELQAYGPGVLRHLMHPRDWEAQSVLLSALAQAQDGDIQEATYRILHKNQEVRWVQARRSVFRRNEKGLVSQIIAIMHDITLLKKAECELIDEHQFLEQVTDKTPHLIYVFDLEEQRFAYINRRVNELIGHTEEYVYAMGPHLFQAVLHPEDLPGRIAYMAGLATLNEQEIRHHEFRIWTGNAFRWFRSKDSIFKREAKKVKQVIGIAEDITYEKMLQERLQRESSHQGLN